MNDEHKWLYRAVGTVSNHLLQQELVVTEPSYKSLVASMARKTEDIRYYTEGVNSYQTETDKFKEAFTKDLIWPEVKWVITRELKEEK